MRLAHPHTSTVHRVWPHETRVHSAQPQGSARRVVRTVRNRKTTIKKIINAPIGEPTPAARRSPLPSPVTVCLVVALALWVHSSCRTWTLYVRGRAGEEDFESEEARLREDAECAGLLALAESLEEAPRRSL